MPSASNDHPDNAEQPHARNTPAPRAAVAVVFAWLLPGLGHIVLGQRARGLIIMVTLVCLYTAGLLIGGIDVIDRREDRLWYAGQVLAGPATFYLDTVSQRLKLRTETQLADRPFPASQPPEFNQLPYVRSVGRVNELGTLYCALAGMLNLLVIIDVLFRADPKHAARPQTPRGYVAQRESGS